jgi:papain like cysteine protease AvrRpt2
MYAPQSWTVQGLVALLKNGPVVMMGYIPSGHAVVLGGIVSDGTANGTTLTVYDPWPPNVGSSYSANYLQMMTRFPMATTYLLQQ